MPVSNTVVVNSSAGIVMNFGILFLEVHRSAILILYLSSTGTARTSYHHTATHQHWAV